MQLKRKIHLLLPDLLWPVLDNRTKQASLRPRFIEKLLTRANKQRFDGVGLEQTLFNLYRVKPDEMHDIPAGAVAYVGEGGNPENYCWAKASPVHLIADGDRLILLNSRHFEMSDSEVESLINLFNSHYAEDGLLLESKAHGSWYLKLPTCPKITTHDVESVEGHSIIDYLPQGMDRSKILKLLNEVQMLYYASDVNSARMAKGACVINGIWLSGVGRAPSPSLIFDATFSSLPIARGLAVLSGSSYFDFSGSISDTDDADGNLLIVHTQFTDSKKEDDVGKWQSLLSSLNDALERYLNGKWSNSELIIYTCRGYMFSIDRRRFKTGFLKLSKALKSHEW